MAIPTSKDQYWTHLKVKYISGLVTSTSSLADNAGTDIKCDDRFEFIDSDGNTRYLAIYDG